MNLLVTGGWYESEDHLDEIRDLGFNLYYLKNEKDELPCDPAIIDGVVYCNVFKWHAVEDFTNLKFVQIESAGYDRVPLEYMKAHNVTVHNVGPVYSGPMSEYIICHLLDWYHNIRQEMENQAVKGWVKNRAKRELTGRTVCIVGTGNIAKYTSRKLKSFDCRVIGITHTVRDIENFDEVRYYDRFHETLSESDIVLLATPPEGRPAISEAELEAMKSDAVLVNVSRGQQIDEPALIDALREGRIGGAILDVFTEEPLPQDSPLWELDNAILTPHSSFIGDGNAERLWQTFRANLIAELQKYNEQ